RLVEEHLHLGPLQRVPAELGDGRLLAGAPQQLLLRQLAARDVGQGHGHGVRLAAVGPAERPRAHGDPDPLTARLLDPHHHLRAGLAGDQGDRRRLTLRLERAAVLADRLHAGAPRRPADDLRLAPAEDPAGTGVATGDGSIGLVEHEALFQRTDDRTVSLLPL